MSFFKSKKSNRNKIQISRIENVIIENLWSVLIEKLSENFVWPKKF